MQTDIKNQLVKDARQIMEHDYVPYSHFPVGAAILMDDGQVIKGVNVENVSFGATNCAERTAIFTAITKGYQPKSIKAIAVSAKTKGFITPCSICRQVMVEMCAPETPVYLTRNDHEIFETNVKELVPFAFDKMDV